MLTAMEPFGPHSQTVRTLGEASFGCALDRVLPEDDYDEQPLIGRNGNFLLAGDIRIDNRDELANKLGLDSAVTGRMSDADMLLAAWETWQLGSLKHLLGDLAFAVWEPDKKQLTLVRSPVALKPLFYRSSADFVAFASMPHGLHALPEIQKTLNFEECAAIIARLPYLGASTIFEGIEMVRHGHAVQFAHGRKTIIGLWDLDNIATATTDSRENSEALRAELSRAVKSQLRRRNGTAACQLSSGRDSSAVATTAALELHQSGENILALTGAPRDGFQAADIGSRLADESVLAAKVASVHPNMIHVICRSKPREIGTELRQLSQFHFGPMTTPSALHWAAEIDEQASARGATILLMGSTGNFSISASGLSHFVDVLREKGPWCWWRNAFRIGGLSVAEWRTISSVSFGPFLPESMYRAILGAAGRAPDAGVSVPVLRQPFREHAESLLREQFLGLRPPRSYRHFRKAMLMRRDNAEKMSLPLSGLDVRDPTGDRRLVELCLTFPPDQLVSRRADPSKVYESAFNDRIPIEVLRNKRRGYQSADWFEHFTRDRVAELFHRYRKNEVVVGLFDFEYIELALSKWPVPGRGSRPALDVYRNQLLSALSLADFIDLHFPS